MVSDYRQKTLLVLVSFMLTYGLIFLLAYLKMRDGTALFNIWIDPALENGIVMGFAALCIARAVYDIVTIDSGQRKRRLIPFSHRRQTAVSR